ncbi:MAG: hypothetical protein ACXWP4_19475 [Polyangiales bacterium]
MRDSNADELVFAIDLRRSAMDEAARELVEDTETARELPEVPQKPIRHVALLVDESDMPVLLPIAPTRDVRFLDALARMLRYARLLGLGVLEVAERHGGAYERALASSGRLPTWAFSGIR